MAPADVVVVGGSSELYSRLVAELRRSGLELTACHLGGGTVRSLAPHRNPKIAVLYRADDDDPHRDLDDVRVRWAGSPVVVIGSPAAGDGDDITYVAPDRIESLPRALERALVVDQYRRETQRAESRYQGLVEALPAVVYIAEPGKGGQWLYVSPNITELLGYSPEEWTSDPHLWFRRCHPDDAEMVERAEAEVLETWKTLSFEYRVLHRDGRVVWVKDQATLAEKDDGPPLLQGFLLDITAQKSAEAELQRSDARTRMIIDSALDCVITADHKGRIVGFNHAAEETFGHRSGDVLGRELAEVIVPPMYRDVHREALRRYVETREPRILGRRLELHAMRSDGSQFPIELTVTAVEDAGQPLFTAFLRDITERKANEEVRRTTARRFRALVQNASDCVTVVGPDSTIGYMSPSVEQILGYVPEDLEGTIAFGFLHPEDLPQVMERFAAVAARPGASETFEARARHKDGSWRWLEAISTNLINDPDIEGIVTNFHDITEQKQSTEARDRLLAVLEATSDLVGLSDPRGRLTYLNAAGRRLLGIGGDEDVSEAQSLDILPEWVHTSNGREVPAVTRDGIWRGEAVLHARDGSEIPMSQVVIAHKGADDEVQFFSTIARDLTDQKRLEAQLLESQKMDAIGRLAGGIAHDFNNLLAVIVNYAGFLREEFEEGDSRREDIEEIESAAERGARLVRQLLAFSRKEVSSPRVLDLNVVVSEMERLLRRTIGEDIELELDQDAELWSVEMDFAHVEQVLINLAVNARDAMLAGGKISLKTSNIELTGSETDPVVGASPGRYVKLTVTDTGCGMSSDVIEHIFEPFFTTKEVGKGTGLGLATVYGIVQGMGGQISVSSEIDRGTTFEVFVPAVDEQPDDHLERSGNGRDPIPTRAGKTVLLVEDEDSVRSLLERMLTRSGYTVIAVSRGPDALEAAQKYSGPIHLLLTDVVMPEMSGKILAQRLVKLRHGFKTIYMSGYAQEDVHRRRVAKDEFFIGKPFTSEELLERVDKALSG